MRNNHPKSENPAMKEKAAGDKNAQALQKTIDAERAAAHPRRNGHDVAAELKSGPRK